MAPYRAAAVLLMLIGSACTARSGGPVATRSTSVHTSTVPSTQGSPSAFSPRPSSSPAVVRDVVWAAVESGGAVVEVDVNTRLIIARHELSGGPHNITVAPGGTVAVSLPQAGRIGLVDGRNIQQVSLGGRPHDVKGADDLIVVANEGAARLDLITVEGRIVGQVALKADPHDLAISPDRQLAWVSLDRLDDLAVVDLASRQVDRYVSTAQRPHDLLFAPDGRLWVTDWSEGVHVYTGQGRPVKTILGGVQVHHLAFTPDGEQAWLTDHDGARVFVADALGLRVLESLPIRGAPHHVTITPNGRLAIVADHDGGRLLLFAIATRRQVASIPIGAGPHGVWAGP
jgi:hypothetical protein